MAYTIENEVIFGEGKYQPDTLEGRRLLTHELVHVIQGGHNIIRRQPVNEKPQITTIPPSLTLEQIRRQFYDDELEKMVNNLNKIISNLKKGDPNIERLKEQVGLIGVELGRRNALRKGRTFDDTSINRMKYIFKENAALPEYEDEGHTICNHPKCQDSCIVILNKATKELHSHEKLKTTNATIEKAMEMFKKQGVAVQNEY